MKSMPKTHLPDEIASQKFIFKIHETWGLDSLTWYRSKYSTVIVIAVKFGLIRSLCDKQKIHLLIQLRLNSSTH